MVHKSIVVMILLFVGTSILSGFAETTTVPTGAHILRITSLALKEEGYVVGYKTESNKAAVTYLPREWFKWGDPKGNAIKWLRARDTEIPSLNVTTLSDGSYRIKMFLPADMSDQLWRPSGTGTDLNSQSAFKAMKENPHIDF